LPFHDLDQLPHRETVVDPLAAALASTFWVAACTFLELSPLGRPAIVYAVSYFRPSLFSRHLIGSALQGIFPIFAPTIDTDDAFSNSTAQRGSAGRAVLGVGGNQRGG